MAYGAEHDRIRAILPDGFTSIRPVLRINAEIRDEKFGYQSEWLNGNTAMKQNISSQYFLFFFDFIPVFFEPLLDFILTGSII
mgnify:CR=1 FL=1